MWRQNPERPEITHDDVVAGIADAEDYMEQMVLDITVKDLSEKDRAFLEAMLQDDAPSRVSDIASRMEEKPNRVAQYRLRLIRQGVIEEYGRGYVQFSMPFMREYLRKTLTTA
jgi:hypothetical protein